MRNSPSSASFYIRHPSNSVGNLRHILDQAISQDNSPSKNRILELENLTRKLTRELEETKAKCEVQAIQLEKFQKAYNDMERRLEAMKGMRSSVNPYRSTYYDDNDNSSYANQMNLSTFDRREFAENDRMTSSLYYSTVDNLDNEQQ
jgi:hypothetical protein